MRKFYVDKIRVLEVNWEIINKAIVKLMKCFHKSLVYRFRKSLKYVSYIIVSNYSHLCVKLSNAVFGSQLHKAL